MLGRNRLRHGFARQHRDVIVESLLLSDRAMAALDDRARMQQFVQRRNNRRAHPVRARGQDLHDDHVAESIDHHARQPVAVAVDKPVRIRIAADEPPPKFERTLQPPRDQFFDRGSLAPRNHPDRDRRRRIVVTHPKQRARRIMHRDERARLNRHGLNPLDRLRENPRIPAAHRPFPPPLEDRARRIGVLRMCRRCHRATAPESKVARRAQLCASHWVQGSPLPPAAQAIILSLKFDQFG